MNGKIFKAILYPLLIACIAAALYLFFYRSVWADDLDVKDYFKDFSPVEAKIFTNIKKYSY